MNVHGLIGQSIGKSSFQNTGEQKKINKDFSYRKQIPLLFVWKEKKLLLNVVIRKTETKRSPGPFLSLFG